MKLREGDRVTVVTGKDAGKESLVIRVIPKKNKIVVENVNTAKRHQRPTRQAMQGGIIDKDMPIDASNVMIPDCGPTRIGYTFDNEGTKRRICRKCGGEL